MRCEHCGSRCADEFRFQQHVLCCGCMAELCSWFLEGGFREEPEQFAELGSVEALVPDK